MQQQLAALTTYCSSNDFGMQLSELSYFCCSAFFVQIEDCNSLLLESIDRQNPGSSYTNLEWLNSGIHQQLCMFFASPWLPGQHCAAG